jgi:quercetin dioxygenase-like cupin family protein
MKRNRNPTGGSVVEEPTAGVDRVIDLAGLASAGVARKPVWSFQGEDLNLNLIVLAAAETIDDHVNREVEVFLVAIAGEGLVEIDGTTYPLRAGEALVVPKGARRSITSNEGRFAYLSCHRRRTGLMPTVTRAARPGHLASPIDPT